MSKYSIPVSLLTYSRVDTAKANGESFDEFISRLLTLYHEAD